MIVAACDKPEAKPPTNIEKDDKADTDTDSKGESGGGSAGKTGTDDGEPADGDADKTSGESVDDGKDAAPAAYSFAFDEASHKIAFTAGTYTQAVVETNKPTGDTRDITYTSSENAIATVDNAGVVTFVTQGTVTITATKALGGEYTEATARYTLYITMKPANKQALADEIKRAMDTHGNKVDLNYIDVSDITDMSYLFSSAATNGYGRQAFNGDISKWNVSSVTNMRAMFSGATAFNKPLNTWNVSSVEDMSYMFNDATAFNQPLTTWKVSNVTKMVAMFLNATSFNQSLDGWNVSSVEDMSHMFNGATSFNQPLNNWNVSSVEDMTSMFRGATTFNQDISGWASKSGRITTSMFRGATAMQTANKPSWAP